MIQKPREWGPSPLGDIAPKTNSSTPDCSSGTLFYKISATYFYDAYFATWEYEKKHFCQQTFLPRTDHLLCMWRNTLFDSRLSFQCWWQWRHGVLPCVTSVRRYLGSGTWLVGCSVRPPYLLVVTFGRSYRVMVTCSTLGALKYCAHLRHNSISVQHSERLFNATRHTDWIAVIWYVRLSQKWTFELWTSGRDTVQSVNAGGFFTTVTRTDTYIHKASMLNTFNMISIILKWNSIA